MVSLTVRYARRAPTTWQKGNCTYLHGTERLPPDCDGEVLLIHLEVWRPPRRHKEGKGKNLFQNSDFFPLPFLSHPLQ